MRYTKLVMTTSTVFTNNRTQAVRLPAELRLPEGVKRVDVRARGRERIIAPADSAWDSFFLSDESVSDDFLPERATQTQSNREAL
jgi:antitoxin VapB